MRLAERLNKLGIVHVLLNRLGLRYVITWLLHRLPLARRLPSGAKYRIRHVESFILASEVFGSGVYATAMPSKLATFVDIGCNTGYFCALVADITGSRGLRGLAIDANPAMYDETRWLLRVNGLDGVIAVNGLAASPGETRDAEFFISDSHIISSRFPQGEPGLPAKGRWHRIVVPSIDIETLWLRHVGDVPCELAKIDIEGGEADLVVPQNPFFKRVDSILLEWHDWIAPRAEMTRQLETMGFTLVSTLEDLPTRGVGLYRRQ
ncbi:MAG: FkbM family methyltransferase [Candidatus Cloacimonetes bacterium]|nr:FkbM family methyltransferase [Candidatus Cloacimonadota bacterium]